MATRAQRRLKGYACPLIRFLRVVRLGHGEDLREYRPGDITELKPELHEFVYRGWAEVVPARCDFRLAA
jgi:hypothetical protein